MALTLLIDFPIGLSPSRSTIQKILEKLSTSLSSPQISEYTAKQLYKFATLNISYYSDDNLPLV